MSLVVAFVIAVVLWIASLLIAVWIVRAGVRGGVQQLVEVHRQALTVLQAQAVALNKLASVAVPKVPSAPAGQHEVDPWDQLRPQ